MTPEEAARAALELKAKSLLPVHAGKFCISAHPWDEPFRRLAEASRDQSFRLLTPQMGQIAHLDDGEQKFFPWWKNLE